MKVLIVFNHPAPYKINFFNELSKSVDLTVIFERDKERAEDCRMNERCLVLLNEFLEEGYEDNGISFGNENYYSNDVVKHLKKNKYDLIIMNGYSTIAEMKAIRYLRKHNMKYVMYMEV